MSVHLHGTRAKYVQGCRCNLCELVNAIPTKPRTPAAASVPTGKTRAHILALRDAGWSFRQIADRSGYHSNTLRRIADRTTLWTSPYTEEDICSIPVRSAAA